MIELSHDYFMEQALKEAQKALDADEVPVGCVIVVEKRIIARAHNQTETLQDVTAHAEILAYTSATQFLGNKYMNECSLYVTLEPCCMCAGALNWAQFGKVIFGASDLKRGYQEFNDHMLHPKTEVIRGIKEKESAELLRAFFKGKRENSM